MQKIKVLLYVQDNANGINELDLPMSDVPLQIAGNSLTYSSDGYAHAIPKDPGLTVLSTFTGEASSYASTNGLPLAISDASGGILRLNYPITPFTGPLPPVPGRAYNDLATNGLHPLKWTQTQFSQSDVAFTDNVAGSAYWKFVYVSVENTDSIKRLNVVQYVPNGKTGRAYRVQGQAVTPGVRWISVTRLGRQVTAKVVIEDNYQQDGNCAGNYQDPNHTTFTRNFAAFIRIGQAVSPAVITGYTPANSLHTASYEATVSFDASTPVGEIAVFAQASNGADSGWIPLRIAPVPHFDIQANNSPSFDVDGSSSFAIGPSPIDYKWRKNNATVSQNAVTTLDYSTFVNDVDVPAVVILGVAVAGDAADFLAATYERRVTLIAPVGFGSLIDRSSAVWTATKSGNDTQFYFTRGLASERITRGKLPDTRNARICKARDSARLWCLAQKLDPTTHAPLEWKLFYSDQGARTGSFKEIGVAPFDSTFKYVDPCFVGNILCAIGVDATNKLQFRKSSDFAATWSDPVTIATLATSQACQIKSQNVAGRLALVVMNKDLSLQWLSLNLGRDWKPK